MLQYLSPLTGPPAHHEARQKALKILQVFLNDACEAAKKYQISKLGYIAHRSALYQTCGLWLTPFRGVYRWQQNDPDVPNPALGQSRTSGS
jgi:hypothetical protein